MNFTQLGKTGIQVSPITFGGNIFGWTVDEQTSFKLLDHFISKEFNLIDTADIYSAWKPGNSGGESETIIGNWFKKRNNRNKVILATKVEMIELGGRQSLKKTYILKSVDQSLQRLKTDYIDLYQSHIDDADTPMEETLDTYAQLIKAGKIRSIGASNFTKERLEESFIISEKYNLPKYQTIQPLYNLYDRKDFEENLEEFTLKNKIGVINYYSLASGFLSGKYRSAEDLAKSARGGRVEDYLNERGFQILKGLDQVSKKYNCSIATVAIAWLLKRKSVTAPIVSATSIEQLDQVLSATKLNLDEDSIQILNNMSRY